MCMEIFGKKFGKKAVSDERIAQAVGNNTEARSKERKSLIEERDALNEFIKIGQGTKDDGERLEWLNKKIIELGGE